MKYHVLSATESDTCPVGLVEDAILYMNKEQIRDDFEYGFLPWYCSKKGENFDLPKDGVLLLKRKNIKLSFRRIASLYIVDEIMKNILEKYIESDFVQISVLNSKLEKYNDVNYYIFKFNQLLNFDDVADLSKSIYKLDEHNWVFLDKIKILEKIKQNIFKINKIDLAQDTFFINENVKNEIDKVKPIGINIFEVDTAKWRHGDDFSYLFLPIEEVNQLVWPI
jgi:hypothetical protein